MPDQLDPYAWGSEVEVIEIRVGSIILLQLVHKGTRIWLEVGHCLDTVLGIERIGHCGSASPPRGGFS